MLGAKKSTLCRNPSSTCPRCCTALKRNIPQPLVAVKHSCSTQVPSRTRTHSVLSAGWVSPKLSLCLLRRKVHTPQVDGGGNR